MAVPWPYRDVVSFYDDSLCKYVSGRTGANTVRISLPIGDSNSIIIDFIQSSVLELSDNPF